MNILPATSRRLSWALAGILVLIAALVFCRVAGFSLVMWDDDRMLYANPHVQGVSSTQLHWMFTDSTYNRLYMPLGWLDYAISYVLFGLDPRAHHLINLALHLINTLLVFAVLRQVLAVVLPESPASNPRARVLAAFAGALFWAIHPLRVEVVAWVGARVHGFAAVFVLSTVWCYFRGSARSPVAAWRRPAYWASVLLFGLSLLSFPIAIMLPAVFYVLDLYVLARPQPSRGWRSAGIFLVEKIPFAMVAAVPLGLSLWGRANTTLQNPAPTLAQFGIFSRLMQACYVWIHYLDVILVPTDLSPVYTQLVNFLPVDSIFLASFGAVAGLTALAFYFRRRYPMLWAAWLCHLLILLPFLGLSEHPHYASDRYTYLASIIWSAVLAAGVWHLLQFKAALRSRQLAGLAAVALVTASFGFLAFQQTTIWVNTEVLFRYVIGQLGNDPYRADIYRRLGMHYLQQRRPAEAIATYNEILLLAMQAREQQHNSQEVRSLFMEAAQSFDILAAASETPQIQALVSAGCAYTEAGFPVSAIQRLELAATLAPRDASIHLNLGKALFQAGKTTEAIAQLDTAITLDRKLQPARAKILADWSAAAARFVPAPRLQ